MAFHTSTNYQIQAPEPFADDVQEDIIADLDAEARNLDLADYGQPIQLQAEDRRPSPVREMESLKSPWGKPKFLDSGFGDVALREKQGMYSRAGFCRRKQRPGSSRVMWKTTSQAMAMEFFDDETRQEDIGQKS